MERRKVKHDIFLMKCIWESHYSHIVTRLLVVGAAMEPFQLLQNVVERNYVTSNRKKMESIEQKLQQQQQQKQSEHRPNRRRLDNISGIATARTIYNTHTCHQIATGTTLVQNFDIMLSSNSSRSIPWISALVLVLAYSIVVYLFTF